jgi:hypothetical protein
VPISIVYPLGRNATAAIKAFVDWIVEISTSAAFE